MGNLTDKCVEHLHHFRLALIWIGWGIAWSFLLWGVARQEWPWAAIGIFVGLGATILVIWAATERAVRQVRLTHDDMATAAIRERQRRDGPRAVD